jgi:hypothetical protein
MAKRQSECEDQIRSQRLNIVENLVLLNYFKISGLPTTNINHWKAELKAAISKASDFKMKNDNSIGRRQRIVSRVFNQEDMTDYKMTYNRAENKFYDEKETQYPDNKESVEWLDEAVIATINQMSDIQELIVKYDMAEVNNWLKRF